MLEPKFVTAADEIVTNMLTASTLTRTMLSRTFWSSFGIKVKTAKKVSIISQLMSERNVIIHTEGDLGKERPNSWIKLSFDPRIIPSDEWFTELGSGNYNTEREVEIYFVEPLFRALMYTRQDFAFGHVLNFAHGSRKRKGVIDLAVFDGKTRDSALVIVEAKASDVKLTKWYMAQAKSYAMWLHPLYYVVTNSIETRVMRLHGANRPDEAVLTVMTPDLRSRWIDLYQVLNRSNVVKEKAAAK